MSHAISQSGTSTVNGARLIAVSAIIGFIICLVDYFTPHGPIAHQWGTLIVLVSTALMIFASAWIAFGTLPHWTHALFEVLIILDIVATGICAYFLEAPALRVFMVIALIGWIWHLASDHPRVSAN
ncbi:MAG: hypothetical protein ACTHLR_18075 [Rhizomicrobium sp.]